MEPQAIRFLLLCIDLAAERDWLAACIYRITMKRCHYYLLPLLLASSWIAGAQNTRSSETAVSAGRLERIDPTLHRLKPSQQYDVIIVHKNDTETGAGRRIESRTGIRAHAHFDNVGSSVARLTRDEIDRLSYDSEVEFIAPNQPVYAFGVDKGNIG